MTSSQTRAIKAILPQVHFSVKTIGAENILNMIDSYNNSKNQIGYNKLKFNVEDGFLFINNESVGRIAPKLPKLVYTEEMERLEGLCIRN